MAELTKALGWDEDIVANVVDAISKATTDEQVQELVCNFMGDAPPAAVAVGEYMAAQFGKQVYPKAPSFAEAVAATKARVEKLMSIKGTRTVDSFHRELGRLLWDKCGMARNKEGLEEALKRIPILREEFWSNLKLLGGPNEINMELERAGRVADFLEFGELMCLDALNRNESCGGHFRTEYQTPDGEALRNDAEYDYVAAWKFEGDGNPPALVKEPLVYEQVKLSTRSYK